MPSNAEFIGQAKELAEKLGITVETDGLSNPKLAELVSDLRAKVRDAELSTQADGDSKVADGIKKAKTPAKKPPFYVAPRKAITSKRGILSGDTADEVKVSDLAGGKDAFEAFIESGHILKG